MNMASPPGKKVYDGYVTVVQTGGVAADIKEDGW